MDYQVRLEVFEGPLDLLLHLIKKSEVDIYNIPIAEITRQYLSYLELMQTLNLDVAGEFLVMAATLTHIKSQTLLPPEESEETEGQEPEDPRAELVRQLLEYKKYKEAADNFRRRESEWQDVFARRVPLEDDEGGPIYYGQEATVFDLLSALQEILKRVRDLPGVSFSLEEVTVTEKINLILTRMTEVEVLPFQDLFAGSTSRMDIIVTFLALLEVVRQGMVRVWQGAPGAPIQLYRSVEAESTHERY